jgi:hypothetical protein
MFSRKKLEDKISRLYSILVLDEHYIELFEVFADIELAKKSFKKQLRERGVGILGQRKHLKEEFYREGEWQIQLIKTEAKTK